MFRLAVVGGPCVEDHGDQTDHDRAADRRPEPRYREPSDQVCGEFQKERVEHNEKEAQRKDDQGKGQYKENGPDQQVQKCEHQDRGDSGAGRVDSKAWYDHDREKNRDARDQDSNDRRANPATQERILDLPRDVKGRH